MDALFIILLTLPGPVWIAIAIILAVGVLFWAVVTVKLKREEAQRRREEERARLIRERAASLKRHQQEAERQKKQRAAALTAARRKQDEQARREDKRRVDALGKRGADLVKRATSSVQKIESSEAAAKGWLGDVDFASDIEDIESDLLKARALRGKSDDLSALPKPTADDRRIVAEAKAAFAKLERRTADRVELLERCATEARLIDESLRKEREDAKLAAKRDELHGELAAMLYGVEAAGTTSAESAADAVMARVQAYRDIRGQIASTGRGSDL